MRKIAHFWHLLVALALFALQVPAMMAMGALSGGYYNNLTEVLKLTSETLIPGVVDENFKRGNPVDLLPFVQANHTGAKMRWVRELTDLEDSVANISQGGSTVFSEGATLESQEAILRICYLMTKLDKYDNAIWQTVNDYERETLEGNMRSITKKLGKKIIYDDFTYDGTGLTMDGLHAWAATNFGEAWDIDEGEGALALENMRVLSDELIQGFDYWLMPFALARRIDAAYREVGVTALKADTAGALGLISYGLDQAGGRTLTFDNKPIIRSDFLVAEQVNTGQGTTSGDARAKYSSGTKMYSIFAIKNGMTTLGQIDPGIKVAFGKTESDGEFFNLEHFDKLEGYIGTAMRLAAYTNLIVGSKYGIGRITDITNAAVTAA
ncbi:hypothetical protein LCGC14_1621390 [marine sediment metagenome]|uniref:Uncharacterized protein n=1 Tax=marine sediment metagenome TaxID=412755 RepID=A0A0F9L5B7_9ZZZZ